MQTALYLEVNLIGIALLLVIYFSYRMTGILPTEQKLFDRLLLVIALVLMTDSIAWCVNDKLFMGARTINMISNVLYFALSPCLGCVWFLYVRYRVGQPIDLRSAKGALWVAPIIANALLSLTTVFTGWYFQLDSVNRYQRGPIFFLYACIGFAYMLLATGAALHRYLRTDPVLRHPYHSLAAFTALPIIGTLLQTVFPWCYTTLISAVLALIIFYIDMLNQQIHTDSLTQLNNRRRMNEYLTQCLQSLPEGEKFFAIMLDVDDFKLINDTHGHQTGDEALRATSQLLKAVCADSNGFLARLGGDEFIILAGGDSDSTPELILDDVQSAFADYAHQHGNDYRLSVSAGYASTDATEGKSAEALLAEADAALYRAKSARSEALRQAAPSA